VGGAKHANRNLAPIGNQELPNCLHASANRRPAPRPMSAFVLDMLH
jgi:hypothetical protein